MAPSLLHATSVANEGAALHRACEYDAAAARFTAALGELAKLRSSDTVAVARARALNNRAACWLHLRALAGR